MPAKATQATYLFVGIVFSAFFFVLLFFEDRVTLFGVSLSNIWKSFLVLGLSAFLIFKFRFELPIIVILPILYVMIYPLGISMGFTLHGLEACVLFVMMPLSYYATLIFFRGNPNGLEALVLGLCLFILFSTIPFILDWVSPTQHFIEEKGEFAASYGSDRSILIGFYKHESYSSKTFAIATSIILFSWLSRSTKSFSLEIIFMSVFAFGLLCLYLTFVRTGWLMLLCIIAYSVLKTRVLITPRVLVISAVIITGLAYLLVNEPAFLNRVTGTRLAATDQSLLVQVSSGRLLIYLQIWGHLTAQGVWAWFIGLGDVGLNAATSGVAPHNFLLQSLAVSGVPGIVLLLTFFHYWRKNIIRNVSNKELRVFNLALFYAMILSSIISHGLGFYGNFLLGAYLAYGRLKSHEINYVCGKNIEETKAVGLVQRGGD